jgi:HK97 family phage major capsid protein
MRTMGEIQEELARARGKRDTCTEELERLDAQAGEQELRGGRRERWENFRAGLASAVSEIETFEDEARTNILEGVARGVYTEEPGSPEREDRYQAGDGPPHVQNARSEALRAIERHRESFTPEAGNRITEHIRGDRFGWESRYLAAVGSDAYLSFFGKSIRGADPHEMTPEESQAFRDVQEARAALAVGADATGGFAIPLTLDPTVMLTSNGSVNPLRQLARVITITTTSWAGVSSAGVTASFSAEAAEVTDDSPTLAQPTATPIRATAFVPYSFEVGQDWAGLQGELARLFADAKDQLEATKFTLGTGTVEPVGIIAGLGTAYQVSTAGTATLAAGDVYALQEALGPRFQPNATFMSSNTIGNRVYRLVPAGSTTEPVLMNADRTSVLGRPYRENSAMVTTVTSASKVLLYGDIAAGFAIIDRVGMSVELVPHLFGSGNRFPTGQRGALAWWRTTSQILVPQAIRLLKMT